MASDDKPILPADWLEQWIEKQKELKRMPAPSKRRQRKVTPMESPRMRRVQRQTSDPVRAAYQPETAQNSTPVRKTKKGLTKQVGPGDKYNKTADYRTGKATESRDPE